MNESLEATRSPIELIPVLDIMNGIVVRGVAGQRQSYLPNQSCLVNSTEPQTVAQAVLRAFKTQWLYVADLDGLQDGEPQWNVLQTLCDQPISLCVDAGLNSIREIERLFSMGAHTAIIAMETLDSLTQIEELARVFTAERLVFSLDLKHGKLLSSVGQDTSPLEVVKKVVDSSLKRLIVLDLAAVGAYDGVPTLELCQQIQQKHDEVEVWTGGGIRSMQDVKACQHAGIDGLLIASALHDNRISPSDWNV